MIYGSGDHRYRVVDGWGCGPEGLDPLGMMTGVATDANDRVYLFRRSPQSSVLVYERDGRHVGSWGANLFSEPHAIWIDGDGFVYCTDRIDHTVRRFTRQGELLMTLGTPNQPGESGMPFNKPAKAVTSPDGEILVADGYGQARVHRFSGEGALLLSWGEPGLGPGQYNLPHSLGVDSESRVIIVDRENHRLQLCDLTGTLLDIWTGFRQPMDLYIGQDDILYVAENLQRVSILSPNGDLLARWGEHGDTPGMFASFLHGVCVDAHGDLYIADESRLQKFERL